MHWGSDDMVDMHIHTNNSDGQYSTKEIIEMLKLLKADVFSITDHDNVDSCKEIENLDLGNMNYIPGVEFSSKNGIYNCHILGYDIDYNNKDLIDECKTIENRRKEKIQIIINHLRNKKNIYLTEEETSRILNKKGTIGRYDICKILMERGYGPKPIVYDNYLSNIEGVTTHRSNIETVTSVIKKANGVPVLAHPKEIEDTYNINIEDIIEDFIDKGIQGIEAYNTIHTLNEVRRYLYIAQKYDLFITGGSDYHGASHPERKLGKTTMYKVQLNSSNIKLH
jgi:hypothetical protein